MPAPLYFIQTSLELPTQADAVVISGGVIGTFTAYYLAKHGLKVALIEKGIIAGEQSSRNWGWCRQQNRDARELAMATKALDLWEQFGAESGEDTGFRRCGLFYVSNNPEEIETWTRWGEFARSVGVKTRMLNAQEATERGGFTRQQWKGGVHSEQDGIANPGIAVPAVARVLSVRCETPSTWRSDHQNRRPQPTSDCHSARAAERRSLKVWRSMRWRSELKWLCRLA